MDSLHRRWHIISDVPELVRSGFGLGCQKIGVLKAENIMPTLSAGFGLDALVQASRERLNLPADDFAQLLSDQLALSSPDHREYGPMLSGEGAQCLADCFNVHY
jgi:hypothetical protein